MLPGSYQDQSKAHLLSDWLCLAYRFVEGDNPAARQDVIQGINTDAGLAFIDQAVERAASIDITSRGRQFYRDVIGPLFSIVSNKEARRSFLMEKALSDVDSFLYGRAGARTVKLFRFIVSFLHGHKDFFDGINNVLTPVFAALDRIVELNGNAKVNDVLRTIVVQLHGLIDTEAIKIGPEKETLLHHLSRAASGMALGLSIPQHAPTSQRIELESKPTFELTIDPPGQLSPGGSRHDNDHQHIVDIQILPTQDEVKSRRTDYLPPRDPRRLHLAGLSGLLDRHFRLVREDAVGPLRDAIRAEVKKIGQQGLPVQEKPEGNSARVIKYHQVRIDDIRFDRDGLLTTVSFAQPLVKLHLTSNDLRLYWEASKCLLNDALVCMLCSNGQFAFMVVCEARVRRTPQQADKRHASIYNDPRRAKIILKLVSPNDFHFGKLDEFRRLQEVHQLWLCEFPGVLLPSFYHTLEALKTMSQSQDMPFAKTLCPEDTHSLPRTLELEPPRYARNDFKFDLTALTDGDEALEFQPRQRFDFEKMSRISCLDEAQNSAVISALGHEIALVQGPPGTGKSFTGVALIRVLLQHSERANLGPIICVCYTNHALDQLLEDLVKSGVKQVIRVGGRSKSEMLEDLNLVKVAASMEQTPQEKREGWERRTKLESLNKDIDGCLNRFRDAGGIDAVSHHLETIHHKRWMEIKSFEHGQKDENGFEKVDYDKRAPLLKWLEPKQGVPYHAPQEQHGIPRELAHLPLRELAIVERRSAYEMWINEIRVQCAVEVEALLAEYSTIRTKQRRLYKERDLRCLQQADIIGVTTSGLARNLELLQRLSSKVLVCEEAGEVLEAHLLTALLPSIEHAILIGDHQQLRPQITNYDLSSANPAGKQYSLDMSLFERLVNPPFNWMSKISLATLEVQRRMHPSIADLVRHTLYPNLRDHESVKAYPQVKGMARRLFWLDHQHEEDHSEQSTSRTNNYEVEMVACLVSHLTRQYEYQSNEIAVITPYLGQFSRIRKKLSALTEVIIDDRDAAELTKHGVEEDVEVTLPSVHRGSLAKAVRMATVDNFQGEEAKVIIVSLVRSNKAKRVGFLNTSNRINVLLSRARHGMYLIGDSSCYEQNEMWATVIQMFRDNDNLANALPLRCPRHSNEGISVSEPDDFVRRSPEGGCNEMCGARLDCGHKCPNKCHAQQLHDAVYCRIECRRPHAKCGHLCSKACGAQCGYCEVPIEDVRLPCGHISPVEYCYVSQDTSLAKCRVKIPHKVSECGHTIMVHCCEAKNDDFRCDNICSVELSCGHNCTKRCYQCTTPAGTKRTPNQHGKCLTICEKPYMTCSHRCTETCHRQEHEVCRPCNQACSNYCRHSTCSKKCQEPCAPCAEICNAGCAHVEPCRLPCAAPCNILPCSMRCRQILDCGHQCPSVCGEECPPVEYCQICCDESISSKTADYVIFEAYNEIDLDADPCYFLSCGHILTMKNLDGIMEMRSHYEMDDNHRINGLNGPVIPFSVQMKTCMECRTPIQNLERYNRVWRRALLDESTKRFITWSVREFVYLSRLSAGMESALTANPNSDIEPLQNTAAQDMSGTSVTELALGGLPDTFMAVVQGLIAHTKRYHPVFVLRHKVNAYLRQVTEQEQPFGRVAALMRGYEASQRIEQNSDDSHDENNVVLEPKQRMQAFSLKVRCDLAILTDFFNVRRQDLTRFVEKDDWRGIRIKVDFSLIRDQCEEMASEAYDRDLYMITVELLVSFARFVGLERDTLPHDDQEHLSMAIDDAKSHLIFCAEICYEFPGSTRGMMEEVFAAIKMLNEATIYQQVSSAEKRAVLDAMAKEFGGTTGHWYYCPNGHPFAIGECGGAMQTATCPECGARVGGTHHETVNGVTRARDLEEALRQMDLDG